MGEAMFVEMPIADVVLSVFVESPVGEEVWEVGGAVTGGTEDCCMEGETCDGV